MKCVIPEKCACLLENQQCLVGFQVVYNLFSHLQVLRQAGFVYPFGKHGFRQAAQVGREMRLHAVALALHAQHLVTDAELMLQI